MSITFPGVKQAAATPPDAENEAQIAEVRRRLEQMRREIAQFLNENQGISEAWKDRLEALDLTAMSLATTIDASQLQGYGAPGGEGAPGEFDPFVLPDLEFGWNGPLIGENSSEHEQLVTGTQEKRDKYGTYEGTMVGEVSHTMDDIFGFSVDDSVDAVWVETIGELTLITIKMRGSDEKKTWVAKIVGPLIIDGSKTTQGILIDASRSIRPCILHSGSGNDTIHGSQASDQIQGGLGDDTIYGHEGGDTIYGDIKGNNEIGGKDQIFGMGGEDRGYGGRNSDTSDGTTEVQREVEHQAQTTGNDAVPANASNYIQSTQTNGNDTDWVASSPQDGVIEVENKSGLAGEITINMQQMFNTTQKIKYTMAFFSVNDRGDLVITFVGEDEHRTPKTFQVIIRDFTTFKSTSANPADSVPTLNINGTEWGDIIDAGSVHLPGGQVINIFTKEGADMAIAPKSGLLEDGVDLESLVGSDPTLNLPPSSQDTSRSELQGFIANLFAAGDEEKIYKVVESNNGQELKIEAKNASEYGQLADDKKVLKLNMPPGFEKAYVIDAPDNNRDGQSDGVYLIFVKPGEPAQTIAINIPRELGIQLGKIQIFKLGSGENPQRVSVNPMYLSRAALADGFMISGGDGHDTLRGSKRARWDANSSQDSITREERQAETEKS